MTTRGNQKKIYLTPRRYLKSIRRRTSWTKLQKPLNTPLQCRAIAPPQFPPPHFNDDLDDIFIVDDGEFIFPLVQDIFEFDTPIFAPVVIPSTVNPSPSPLLLPTPMSHVQRTYGSTQDTTIAPPSGTNPRGSPRLQRVSPKSSPKPTPPRSVD